MFNKLRKLIPDLSKAKVIEAIIDPSVHIEYIEYSAKISKNIDNEQIINESEKLFLPETTIEEKKRLLVLMAKIDKVDIFRKLQKYSENPDPELKDWSIIALQESLNLIQSSLLGEEQILISTGLGGKNNKMRFFIVIQNQNSAEITEVQQRIIKKEVEYAFEQNDCELENIEFGHYFLTLVGLFTFDFDTIEKTLSAILIEAKNFNIELSEKYIITNVKVSTLEESEAMLKDLEQRAKSNSFEEDFELKMIDFEELDSESFENDNIDGIDEDDEDDFDDEDDEDFLKDDED